MDVEAARAAGMGALAVTWGAGLGPPSGDRTPVAVVADAVGLRAGCLGVGAGPRLARVHGYSDQQLEVLGDAILAYSADRLKLDPVPLDGPRTLDELDAAAGQTITPDGIGGLAALKLFEEDLAPACISTDHPRYLSFIPCAPTEAAAMFDLVVGASSIYGGSWLEGAGAVYAENQALRWIADLVGLPPRPAASSSPGGTIGNLSALVAARAYGPQRGHPARAARGRAPARGASPPPTARTPRSSRPATSWTSSSSVSRSTRWAPDRGRPCARCCSSTGPRRSSPWSPPRGPPTSASSTTSRRSPRCAGSSGSGSTSTVRTAAPGLPRPRCATCTPASSTADSFIVDPHKWLFAPFDCCALLYREPALARAAHTQHASYLDVLTEAARLEPHRLLRRPDPSRPRAAVLVLASPPTAPRPTPRRSSGPWT